MGEQTVPYPLYQRLNAPAPSFYAPYLRFGSLEALYRWERSPAGMEARAARDRSELIYAIHELPWQDAIKEFDALRAQD